MSGRSVLDLRVPMYSELASNVMLTGSDGHGRAGRHDLGSCSLLSA